MSKSEIPHEHELNGAAQGEAQVDGVPITDGSDRASPPWGYQPLLNCVKCGIPTRHVAAERKLDHWNCSVCQTERHWGGSIVGLHGPCPYCPSDVITHVAWLLQERGPYGKARVR